MLGLVATSFYSSVKSLYGPPLFVAATVGGGASAALFENPMVAILVVCLAACLGVIGSAFRDTNVALFSRRFLGNMLVAVFLGLGSFAYFEDKVENNLKLIVLAFIVGLFLDLVVLLLQEGVRQFLTVALNISNQTQDDSGTSKQN